MVQPRMVSRVPVTPVNFRPRVSGIDQGEHDDRQGKIEGVQVHKESRCSAYRYRGHQYISMFRKATSGRKMNMAFDRVPKRDVQPAFAVVADERPRRCAGKRGFQAGRL